MSVYYIQMMEGKKIATPINSADEYRRLRDSEANRNNVKMAREGDASAKRRLVQFCYNSHHKDGLLAGESLLSDTFGFDYDDPTTREDFIDKALSTADELGLLMLERSVNGAHAVFRRLEGESILEAQLRVARRLEVEFDNSCKDPNRVFFSTTASQEDLVYLDDALFNNLYDEASAKAETEAVMERVAQRKERVPANLLKANKHWKPSDEEGTDAESVAALNEAICEDDEEGVSAVCDEACNDMSHLFGDEATEQLFVERVFKLCNFEVDSVKEGVRNSAVFAVANKLRYVCDFNMQKIKAMLYPVFTFGLEEKEVESILRSALGRDRGFMPRDLKMLVDTMRGTQSNSDESQQQDEAELTELDRMVGSCYPDLEQCVVAEVTMPRMPKLLETILKAAPFGYKRQILCAITPALATVLTDVMLKYGDKRAKRLNCWSHLDGPPSSNKGLMKQPIEEIIWNIRQQDNRNLDIINEAKKRQKLNKNKEEQEAIPELPIRILACDTTRKAHIQLMVHAKGKHTYTYAEELDSLGIRKGGYYDRSDFERLMFDNGSVGNQTAVDDSPCLRCDVAWNVTTSGTRDQLNSHWNSATDGSITRIWFELMPDGAYAEKPKYYEYSEEEKAYIHRAMAVMAHFKGLLPTPRLDKAMLEWNDRILADVRLHRNRVRSILKNRSQEIAHTFGGIVYCCDIAQRIMRQEDAFEARKAELRKAIGQLSASQLLPSGGEQNVQSAPQQDNLQLAQQDSLQLAQQDVQQHVLQDSQQLVQQDVQQDVQLTIQQLEEELIKVQNEQAKFDANKFNLSLYSESKSIIELAVYMADNILNTQELLWGRKLANQMVSACMGQAPLSKTDSDLSKLPTQFTLAEAKALLPGRTEAALRKMLERFVATGSLTSKKDGRIATYTKVNKYRAAV